MAGFITLTLAACGGGATSSSNQVSASDSGGTDASNGGTSSTAGVGGMAGATATAGASTTDLPCEVQALLANKCLSCHQVDPPAKLLSSADFRRASKLDAAKSVGQVAVERVSLTTNLRMPPAPLAAATATEIAALSAWVDGGALAASCGQPVATAPDPYDTPVVCTSMTNWTGGNRESPQMRPGGACISCHQRGEGPTFALAGTLFPTAHEPDDCNGVSSAASAQVIVTEANGTAHTLAVNQAGNFYLEARSFAFPYQAKVVYQDRERVMVEAQSSGDCNDCHTQDGRNRAPGRIFLP
ncbi:MAG TPA: hypothetical protein VEQ59_05415 [Polyangiaceae bacterium]|nr:hypothetical protein [Polyangiaceae bacterium]